MITYVAVHASHPLSEATANASGRLDHLDVLALIQVVKAVLQLCKALKLQH